MDGKKYGETSWKKSKVEKGIPAIFCGFVRLLSFGIGTFTESNLFF
jgi:hypothetical protein